LKFGDVLEYSADECFGLVELVLPFDFVKLVILFDVFVLLEYYAYSFIILFVENGVNALHFSAGD
jgi:hypothetical protein